MEDTVTRFFSDLTARLDGPLHFRFFLQPLMATIFAIRDGRKDAREGRPAYFWSLFTQPNVRGDLLRDGWKSISKVFIIAVVLDLVYQLLVHRWIYPGETLLVAALLALLPYVLVRGPVNRLFRNLRKPPTVSQPNVVPLATARASATRTKK